MRHSARPSSVSSPSAHGVGMATSSRPACNDWREIGEFSTMIAELYEKAIWRHLCSMQYGLLTAVTSSSPLWRLDFTIQNSAKVKHLKRKFIVKRWSGIKGRLDQRRPLHCKILDQKTIFWNSPWAGLKVGCGSVKPKTFTLEELGKRPLPIAVSAEGVVDQWLQVAQWPTREDQKTAPALSIYSSCELERYSRWLANSTVVYYSKPIAYRQSRSE